MPNRILREGILTSELVNALSAPAEIFFRRLMSVVDDYGRCEAHPAILRAKCYPLKLDSVTDKQVQAWLTECAQMSAECAQNDRQPLVSVYTVLGKTYLQINNFQQRTRTASKCPSPCAQNDGQRAVKCPQDARLVGGVVGVGGEGVGVGEDGSLPPPSDAGDADTSKIATLPNREGLNGPPYRTAWQFDESFEPLVALYRESGAAVIDDDFAEAHGAWTRLDWEARAQRVNAFRAKVEASEFADPAFIPRPRKFIESEWKRPIVTRQQQQKTKAREVRII